MEDLSTILLIDDNIDDYEATERSFRKNHIINPIKWCQSGQEAKDYLFKEGRYHNDISSPPTLILLDLNMPGIDGRELLKIIKKNTSLKSIPVIILTTSKDENDIDICYASGASTYIQKPIDMNGLTDVVHKFKQYWFNVAILPRHLNKSTL
ncbi:response regulator [Marinibactrum halimedae]|uniref:Response regulator n=1 Tax=Marinibactrum halimedae TaxID=1444977 RepID=A0AA37T549_9GAMM|nr:response regulator [Marinibactrum halimedae]MCD9459793.1 response regulator [Marinibactrum halimedae]GLS27014.1 response regulator [Marinibactrum halimedae]